MFTTQTQKNGYCVDPVIQLKATAQQNQDFARTVPSAASILTTNTSLTTIPALCKLLTRPDLFHSV